MGHGADAEGLPSQRLAQPQLYLQASRHGCGREALAVAGSADIDVLARVTAQEGTLTGTAQLS